MQAQRVREVAFALTAALAGAAALAYETAWTRLLGLALGHEQLGVLSVLAGFFAGLAAGAGLSHRFAARLRRPAWVFAGLQLVAAGYAAASPSLLTALGRVLPAYLGLAPRPGLAVLSAATILLPATAAVGASLPALIELRRRQTTDDARGLARLYAMDTLGATLGVLVTIHLLLPQLGVPMTSLVAAALSLGAAGLALIAAPAPSPSPSPSGTSPTPSVGDGDPDDHLLRERWLLYLAIALTGLLGLGLEVVAVRVLAQRLSGTIYSFADLLAVWLLGTAAGAGLHARASRALLGRRPATVLVVLLLAQAILVALAAWVATASPTLLASLVPPSSDWARRQLAEVGVAALVLGPVTLVMGLCFAHLLALLAAPTTDGASTPGVPRAIGGALAINALAAAVAPALFGLGLLGRLSYLEVWSVVAWGYLLLALAVAWLRRFPRRQLALAAALGGASVMGLTAAAGSLVLIDTEESEGEGWTLLERREAALGVVSVSETSPPPLRRLRVDRYYRMGGAMSIGERRMGHLPLLLGLDPRRALPSSVLFLGVGTGATAGAGLGPYGVGQLTGVELVPEVLEMLPYFEAVNAGLAHDPRARLLAADARRVLLADDPHLRHEVIVADLFHPARDGAGGLYTREHFAAARDRLAPGGLFVQWLPLHQLDAESLATISRSFLAELPEAHAMLALYNASTPALGLFGSVEPLRIDLEGLRARLEDPANADLYAPLALTQVDDLFAGYMLDRAALAALAGEGPVNDDLHPRVELWAPRAEVGPLTGAENLERILAHRVPWPDPLVTASPRAHAALRQRSARFAAALASYLEGEIAILRASTLAATDTPPTRDALAHHLAAYEIEPEFLPPRPRLYAAAAADPNLAEWILPTMLERTPDQPRVHDAWIAHLARIGDQSRLSLAIEARANLGPK
ncbi:hypothetical protein G6O69_04730 [Pseudenhygromyxa sp. WMMC2535]|uniref:hypothetical protein n=1 Tax=Pseudenhygromyxa sp. WMMC2535 TaxID=2712867 RepID=UPI001554BCAA|nr:hypothetical protein [Pseudenhygromyxa sp. WMMC2535]NVB37124.1 hypothetical protein [Pseudenhygromyxa sp. WMMC2535]